jgi:hypothetical protein
MGGSIAEGVGGCGAPSPAPAAAAAAAAADGGGPCGYTARAARMTSVIPTRM